MLKRRKIILSHPHAYQNDLERFASYCAEEYQESSIDLLDYPLIRSWIVHLGQGKKQ